MYFVSFFFYRSWVLQFEDLLLVQTKLAMLQLGVCVCVYVCVCACVCVCVCVGGGGLYVSYVHCRRLPYVDKCACSITPP